jgi:hypothetical protein
MAAHARHQVLALAGADVTSSFDHQLGDHKESVLYQQPY